MIGLLVSALFFFGKIFELDPFTNWSWWIILTPVALTLFWYEVIEKKFDLRTKREAAEAKKRHEERIRKLQGQTRR
jgi:small Trp-rich protein